MKVGDVVNIYEDPMARKKLEGKAKLLDPLINNKDDAMAYWHVEFKNGDRVARWIRKEDEEEKHCPTCICELTDEVINPNPEETDDHCETCTCDKEEKEEASQ